MEAANLTRSKGYIDRGANAKIYIKIDGMCRCRSITDAYGARRIYTN